MFGLFRKKNDNSLMSSLSLDDPSFIKIIEEVMGNQHPVACSLCVIAYENIRISMPIIIAQAQKPEGKGLPKTTEEFIEWIVSTEKSQANEINRRRSQWFFLAAMLKRATERGLCHRDLQDTVARIWVTLSRGCQSLHQVVSTNKLWSANEKAFFVDIATPVDGVRYCATYVAPKQLHTHPLFQRLAEEFDIYLPMV